MSDSNPWVTIGIVDPEQGPKVYQWHRGFAAADDHIFPRPVESFEQLAEEGQLLYAANARGDYLGLAYFRLDGSKWEIGGLMVDTREKQHGIGGALTRLTLGHVLFEENPLERGEKIVAHVHAENNDPRPLIEQSLKFHHTEHIEVPTAKLPGLKANASGLVVGDEFELTVPDTLLALATWCETWGGKLKDDRPVRVVLRDGVSLAMWAVAFRQMADGS